MWNHRSIFLLARAVPKLKPVKGVLNFHVFVLEVDSNGRVNKFLEIIIHDSFDEGALADMGAAEQANFDVFLDVVIFIFDYLFI